MQKIIIASKNPVKINAALIAFKKMFAEEEFQIEGISVPSGVKDQPNSDFESLQGALNRAHNASEAAPADFWVGMEGGVEEKNGDMKSFAWIVIKSKNGQIGKACTGAFCLPPRVAELIKAGKELGEADDIVFGLKNSKQVNGAIGILTGDIVDRTKFYADAVLLALIPFKNRHLY